MTTKKCTFFEYPRLWTDDRENFYQSLIMFHLQEVLFFNKQYLILKMSWLSMQKLIIQLVSEMLQMVWKSF